LEGANLGGAGLQGADLGGVDFAGASLAQAQLWRTQNEPTLRLTDTTAVDLETPPKLDMATLQRAIAENLRKDDVAWRLQMANPAGPAPEYLTPAKLWTSKLPATKDLAHFLAGLACRPLDAGMTMEEPYIARGLLANDRLLATESDIMVVAKEMRAGK